ncbi:hypothetical protein ACH5RR_039229 [Cinchona calisaya]|uniref:Uncharacterized protein n=1 Tax=Cinchona calisaya TaxID=153742 RepID=A0ABD2XXL9_9GENT
MKELSKMVQELRMQNMSRSKGLDRLEAKVDINDGEVVNLVNAKILKKEKEYLNKKKRPRKTDFKVRVIDDSVQWLGDKFYNNTRGITAKSKKVAGLEKSQLGGHDQRVEGVEAKCEIHQGFLGCCVDSSVPILF